jgi:hypothetical protein
MRALGRPLKQGAALDAEELDEQSKRVRDLRIDVRWRGADERGRDVSEKAFEGAEIE